MGEAPRVYKVALFGITGCGKSSIINLLAGEQVAEVSTGVDACTTRARWYPISLGKNCFRLWDTIGFNQAEARDVNPLSPYEQAHALLRNLPDGIDLILLCSRTDRISASLRRLYWLLDSFFFGGRAQIALILTHFDTIPEQQQSLWWSHNMNDIAQRSGIPVPHIPHACVTTVYDGSFESNPLYQQSKQTLEALLEKVVDASPTPFPRDPLSGDTAAESLSTYCQMGIRDATTLVEKFRLPQRPHNVVLFGEAGAGKSSIVNLLAGRPVAKVSDNIDSCTMNFSSYEINTGLHQCLVWDTVGHNGTHIEHDMCLVAIQNAVRLVRNLHKQGGVDLLVFCKKSGRVQQSDLNTFRLFYEFLCEGRVPVAFIITNLESSTPMEEWWEKNGDAFLRKFNIQPSDTTGHACITALASEDPKNQLFYGKILSSRQSVQVMLEDSISYGNAYNKDEGTWVMAFLKKLVGMVQVGNLSKRERITVKNLTGRCGLSKEHAEELVRLLYTQG